MEQYVIKGGQPLEGEVTIAGAKNAALGILAAAVMTDQEVIIENVPNVRDTRVLLQAIQGIGATVRYIDEHTVSICGAAINPNSDLCVDDEFIRKIRASYYLLGALLGNTSTLRLHYLVAVILVPDRLTFTSKALKHLVLRLILQTVLSPHTQKS